MGDKMIHLIQFMRTDVIKSKAANGNVWKGLESEASTCFGYTELYAIGKMCQEFSLLRLGMAQREASEAGEMKNNFPQRFFFLPTENFLLDCRDTK